MAPKPGRQETRQGRTKSMIKMLRPVAALGALTLAVLLSVAPVAAQQSNPDQAASPPAAGSPPPPLAGGPQGPGDFGRGPVPRQVGREVEGPRLHVRAGEHEAHGDNPREEHDQGHRARHAAWHGAEQRHAENCLTLT